MEPLGRGYRLDEILASVDLRNRMRSISIDTINFEFGSADVAPDQAQMLEPVAAVMRDMAKQNPGEVFLIEGHTDAVGSDIDNLSLSDRRAQAIADLLAQQFGIPAENLVTQGYGKQFLLVPTPEPERRNRRVVIRRITPLLQSGPDQSAANGGPGDGPWMALAALVAQAMARWTALAAPVAQAMARWTALEARAVLETSNSSNSTT